MYAIYQFLSGYFIKTSSDKVLDQFTSKSSRQRANDLKETLIGRISERIRDVHAEVDSKPFFTAILNYKVTPEAYFYYLFNMYHIYKTREQALERVRSNSIPINQVCFSEIYRTFELERDMNYFAKILGIDINSIKPFKSTDNYITYLNKLEKETPIKLIGSYYIESYGNLAGGITIAQRIRKTLNPDPVGMSFYNYPELKNLTINWKGKEVTRPTPGQFKNYFQDLINVLLLSEDEENNIIDASYEAFKMIGEVIEELSPY